MRIWHEQLIPKLCQKHLCAMWREGLGAYKIITEGKKGYRNHPAVKEFEDCPSYLFHRLLRVRAEMINRGYNPKPLPLVENLDELMQGFSGKIKPWQTLDEQVAHLRAKGCKCDI